MRYKLRRNATIDLPGRRSFLRRSSAVAGLGLVGGIPQTQVAFADALSKEQRAAMSPDQILAAMKKGNDHFRKGYRKNRNYLNEAKASAKGQYPAAVILSCIDSRAPAQGLMDLRIAYIFNPPGAGTLPCDAIPVI